MRNSHVLLLGEGPGPEPTLPVSFPDVAELNLLDLLNVDAETLQELARAGRVLSLSTSYFHLSAPGNFWGATAAMGNQNAHFLEDLLFPQFSLLQVRVGDATRTAILPTNSALGGGAPQSRLSLLTIPLGHMQSALTAHRLLRVQFLPRALHSHPIGLAVLPDFILDAVSGVAGGSFVEFNVQGSSATDRLLSGQTLVWCPFLPDPLPAGVPEDFIRNAHLGVGALVGTALHHALRAVHASAFDASLRQVLDRSSPLFSSSAHAMRISLEPPDLNATDVASATQFRWAVLEAQGNPLQRQIPAASAIFYLGNEPSRLVQTRPSGESSVRLYEVFSVGYWKGGGGATWVQDPFWLIHFWRPSWVSRLRNYTPHLRVGQPAPLRATPYANVDAVDLPYLPSCQTGSWLPDPLLIRGQRHLVLALDAAIL